MSATMSMLMVASGGLCACSGVVNRRWFGLIAPLVMLAAMIDLSYIGTITPLLWSCALILAGLGSAIMLRSTSPQAPPAIACASGAPETPSRLPLGRIVAVLSATAFPIMAWQILQHGGTMPGPDPGMHVGHSTALPALWMTGAAALLALLFAACAVAALRRGRRLLALDSLGMGTMLAVMLLSH